MKVNIFSSTSRKDFCPSLKTNQRYRNSFNDKRLSKRYDNVVRAISKDQTCVLYQLWEGHPDVIAAYRFLHNSKVSLSELIYESTQIDPLQIQGKSLQVNIDRSNINLKLHARNRKDWVDRVGVIDDNRSPGFFITPAQVLDLETRQHIGLADILVHTRPKAKTDAKQSARNRKNRSKKLNFKERESGTWAFTTSNVAKQLQAADQITYVIDSAGDSYELFHHILSDTGRDFVIRSKTNRQAQLSNQTDNGTYSSLLAKQDWLDIRTVNIRGLNHYSKSKGKQIKRKKRKAKLAIRFIEVLLDQPGHLSKSNIEIDQPFTLVEVYELSESVPAGEEPIHWRLLCSWSINSQLDLAWKIVEIYQGRWPIEQVFRCNKTQGLNIEKSQLRDPEAIKKLAILAMKASSEAMKLTQARDGEDFIPIEEMFNEEKQTLLHKLNERLSGTTEKRSNPHSPDSLAWAAWIIARLGGWKGYASQRKPGPITMMRGIVRFNDLFFWTSELNYDP